MPRRDSSPSRASPDAPETPLAQRHHRPEGAGNQQPPAAAPAVQTSEHATQPASAAPVPSGISVTSAASATLHLHPSPFSISHPCLTPISSRGSARASVLSGEEGDSEPSSGTSSLAGSTDQLARLVMRQRGMSTASLDDEADREVRLVTNAHAAAAFQSAPPSPAQPGTHGRPGWKASSSSLNLLLSSHLSRHFGLSSSAPAGPSGGTVRSWWRRWFSPWSLLTPKGVTTYSAASLVLVWLVRAASRRSRVNRTMLTFGAPFLVRELPHIFAGAIVLLILRVAPSIAAIVSSAPRTRDSLKLLVGLVANLVSLVGLGAIFQRMLRVGAHPFRRAMMRAGIPVPTRSQEDVLTIVPVQVEPRQSQRPRQPTPTAATPLPKTSKASKVVVAPSSPAAVAATSTALATVTSSAPVAASDPPAISTLSTSEIAYSRIGRMTPMRWFLSCTQLTKTLAWFQEIQWSTGVVFERIHTRAKTHVLKLDIYRPKVVPADAKLPVFLYIHGGGWVTGHRSFHSLALLYAIAKAGFLVASVNYRLSPWVKHPTHLMDCKRSLAWLRQNAGAFGGDSSFVVVGGESAGAHLACLMALTPNVLHLQPGFEHVDTAVQGCVDLYGPHDFTDSHYHYRSREDPNSWIGGFDMFLHRVVMGTRLSETPALYEMASPIFRLTTASSAVEVPPFFAAHGTHDELVPVEDSMEFYKKLEARREREQREFDTATADYQQRVAAAQFPKSIRTVGLAVGRPVSTGPSLPPLPPAPVQDVFVRVPHASHVFNNVLGLRSFALNDSVTVWLAAIMRTHRERLDTIAERARLADLHGADAHSFPAPTIRASAPPSAALLLEMQQAAEVTAADRAQEAKEQAASHHQPQQHQPHHAPSHAPLFQLVPKL